MNFGFAGCIAIGGGLEVFGSVHLHDRARAHRPVLLHSLPRVFRPVLDPSGHSWLQEDQKVVEHGARFSFRGAKATVPGQVAHNEKRHRPE